MQLLDTLMCSNSDMYKHGVINTDKLMCHPTDSTLILQRVIQTMWLSVIILGLSKRHWHAQLLRSTLVLRLAHVKLNWQTLRPSCSLLKPLTAAELILKSITTIYYLFIFLYSWTKESISLESHLIKGPRGGNTLWLAVCYSTLKICFNVQ